MFMENINLDDRSDQEVWAAHEYYIKLAKSWSYKIRNAKNEKEFREANNMARSCLYHAACCTAEMFRRYNIEIDENTCRLLEEYKKYA